MKNWMGVLCILLMTSASVWSQKITGQLVTSNNQQVVPFASVVLLDASGKILVGETSNNKGYFSLNYNKNIGEARILISFIGFESVEKVVQLNGTDIHLKQIKLIEELQKLNESKVTATATRAVLKGDTTELNAAAFKVNPDASAQDLITKMPGVQVQAGKVQAQGEEVKKILVDGKEYFGTDVNAALGNLPADMIDKVQIFDEQSEMSRFTGFNDGNTNKAINIITKNGANKSVTGRFFAGLGTDDRYKLTASVNQINGNQRLALMAQSNNLNEQNFSISDITGSSANAARGARGRNNQSANFMVNSNSGITRTHAAGINFNDLWIKNKLKFTGSYFFNQGYNVNEESTYRTYITEQTIGQVYTEQVESNSNNYDHRFNFRLEYQIDSANSILITPRLNIQNNSGWSELNTQLNNSGTPTNDNRNIYNTQLSGISFTNAILYRHKFNNQRSVTFGFDQAYNNTLGTNHQVSNYLFHTSRPDSAFIQDANLNQTGWTLAGNFGFTQAINKWSMLMADYQFRYTLTDSEKKVSDLDSVSHGFIPNIALSNVFKSAYLTHAPGLSYLFNNKNIQLNFRFAYQYSDLNNQQIYPSDHQLDQQFNALLPSTRLMYRFSKTNNWMLSYRTSVSTPSISQLQNVIDNTNPLQLRAGNPALNQNYQHGLFTRYSATSASGNSFFVMLAGRLSDSYIANSTFIAPTDTLLSINGGTNMVLMTKNAQLSQPVNMNGYYTLSSNATYGVPLKPIKSNLNINAAVSYSRTPGIINGIKNFVYQPNFGGGFTLSSNISQFIDFTFRTNISYNIVKNSIQSKSDNNFYNLNNSFRANIIFLSRFVLSSDINQTTYSGLSSGENQHYVLWNAGLGYKVFRNKQGEFKLSVFDILKQNESYSRNTTNLYNEEVQSKTLAQYFMFSFIYNLKYFTK